MLRVNIRQQYAQIQLNIKPPQLELKSTLPAMAMNSEAAKVEITRVRGGLDIDQYPSWYSRGIRNFADMAHDIAAAGMRQAAEFAARISQDGDRMAQNEKKTNAAADIAYERLQPPETEVELTHVERPQIRYTPDKLEFQPQAGKVNVAFHPGRVENNFAWGQVDIRPSRYNSIRMWTTKEKWDVYA
ncbi:MAG TPA: DUF6470 family protein [Methylomusa anaerophila]|uniref:Uncharacterized protein n=1 Tax=Methylomusa anaerophila TaxID=1930071 RepID=A0A348AKU5_9FIRM|nr:DUF6470 family protein [Methylomusa anaerophila]BBB91693.1 hypothetical protein MAMMFC1_02377 [Methylomusa anaerophila]HML88573.1 DUF6470 family protein [Methylomusa anaerophila]